MRKATSPHADEKEVWAGGYSIQAFYGSTILLASVSLIALIVILVAPGLRGSSLTWTIYLIAVIGCLGILYALYLYNRFNRWFVVTTERIIHREGIFVRRHHVLELIRVDDVTFEQGPIDSLIGCGSIFIDSTDSSHPELELSGIREVQKIADLIDSCRRAERKKRGIHVESI